MTRDKLLDLIRTNRGVDLEELKRIEDQLEALSTLTGAPKSSYRLVSPGNQRRVFVLANDDVGLYGTQPAGR